MLRDNAPIDFGSAGYDERCARHGYRSAAGGPTRFVRNSFVLHDVITELHAVSRPRGDTHRAKPPEFTFVSARTPARGDDWAHK